MTFPEVGPLIPERTVNKIKLTIPIHVREGGGFIGFIGNQFFFGIVVSCFNIIVCDFPYQLNLACEPSHTAFDWINVLPANVRIATAVILALCGMDNKPYWPIWCRLFNRLPASAGRNGWTRLTMLARFRSQNSGRLPG